jgi:hypothetical protein
LWTDGLLADAVRHHEKWIAGEVLAEGWELLDGAAPDVPGVERVDVDGYGAAIRLEKI